MAALIRPETKLVSLTTPHNPTGTEIPADALRAIIAAVEQSNAYLLLDETYRELAPVVRAPWAVESERVISVSSLSKTYGIPGIRLGWLICRDQRLMETLLAGKEQIALGGSVIDEEIARQVLARRETLLPAARAHAAGGFEIAKRWMATEPLLGMGRADRRSRQLSADRGGRGDRPDALSPDPERELRHLRRPRPLVRAGPASLPPRLWLPDAP